MVHGAGLGTIGEGGNNSWGLEEDVEEEGEMEEKTADKRTKQKGTNKCDKLIII